MVLAIYYIYIIGGISLSYQKMKRYSWRQVLQGKYNRRKNCFLVNHKIKHIDIYLKDLRIKFHLRYPLVVIPELETLMLDILNCSSLISISSLNTFDFLLNSFLDISASNGRFTDIGSNDLGSNDPGSNDIG